MFKLQVKEVHPGSCFGIELAVIDFKYRGKTFVGSISYAFSEIALILYETNLPQCQLMQLDLTIFTCQPSWTSLVKIILWTLSMLWTRRPTLPSPSLQRTTHLEIGHEILDLLDSGWFAGLLVNLSRGQPICGWADEVCRFEGKSKQTDNLWKNLLSQGLGRGPAERWQTRSSTERHSLPLPLTSMHDYNHLMLD